MRLAYSILVLSFAIQAFAYLGQVFNIFYPFNFGIDISEPTIFGIFQIDLITGALLGAGAVAIGIGAILTRSGTYAIYTLLIYGIGIFVTQVQDFFLAIPRMITLFNLPNFPGTTVSTAVPIMGFVGGLLVFAWGFFLLELITQRNYT